MASPRPVVGGSCECAAGALTVEGAAVGGNDDMTVQPSARI
ncbi:hypothetical protein [Pandoraea captiosa]|nr:hypothetical protein [Pandoraea captiosa]